MAKKTDVQKNDLLFHPAHGLCKVTAITKASGSTETTYCLFPTVSSHANVRFLIPLSSFENSGFNKLVTPKEAQTIIKFFKTGNKKNVGSGQAWQLTTFICSQTCSKEPMKDARNRHILNQSVKNLVSELALVLSLPPIEIAKKIRESLKAASFAHPLVLAALASISED